MEKKILVVLWTVCFSSALFLVSVNSSYAAKKEASISSEEIIAQQAREAQLKAREILKAKEWIIYMTPASGQSGVTETDALTFNADDAVSSKNLSAQGYGSSNYRVTVEGGGLAAWETMQVNAGNDLVFLRGELRGEAMNGTIFMKPQKGQNKTYNFSTVKPVEEPAIAAPKKKSGK